MRLNSLKVTVLFIIAAAVLSCDALKSGVNSVNIFPISQDKQLGLQVKAEIASKPNEYKLLERSKHKAAYKHLDRMMTTILNSGQVKYKDEFAWEAYLVHDDNVLNAFCTPGGYIYVYTGLIKYLDNESDLAGVLGHEIAHADRRHSTAQLTKLYGVEILSSIALGENSGTTIAQVAKSLASLKFSRSHETDADANSVKYLCPTEYEADGAAGFFQKLLDNQQAGGTPEFLSTHPSPANRVEKIKAEKIERSCSGGKTFDTRYKEFQNALP
ncbi:MAG: M48 family metalloprotease [Bacteroidia bacterium]